MELCKPANLILLISIAAIIYHVLVLDFGTAIWWFMTGLIGTVTFQALCYSGFEGGAWILMLIPVLIVCFFLAVALLASSLRIKNVVRQSCKKPTCKPKCNRTRCGCSDCVKMYQCERAVIHQ